MNSFRVRSNSNSSLAYNRLTNIQQNLNTNLERLSSGKRINTAKDDVAGTSISTRMNNQIRGMKQANHNAQQTNNLLQTAESGLRDISDILTRMRELSVQASTDTLIDIDRASLDLEYQSLLNEISRTAKSTNYNDLKILDSESVKYDNFFTVISSEAENSGVEGADLNRAKAGVYRFESKTPGELTLIHTLSGEKQTVTVPTNAEQGTRINFNELGVKVEFNNQYDGSITIGQDIVDQAQETLNHAQTVRDTAVTDLNNAENVLKGADTNLSSAQNALSQAENDLVQAQSVLDQANTNLAEKEAIVTDAGSTLAKTK